MQTRDKSTKLIRKQDWIKKKWQLQITHRDLNTRQKVTDTHAQYATIIIHTYIHACFHVCNYACKHVYMEYMDIFMPYIKADIAKDISKESTNDIT